MEGSSKRRSDTGWQAVSKKLFGLFLRPVRNMDNAKKRKMTGLLWPKYSVAIDSINRNAEMIATFQRFEADGVEAFANKFELYPAINKKLGDVSISYLEFGVWQGVTLGTWTGINTNKSSRFYGFDSFEGLPEPTSDTSVEIWKRGALTTSEQTFMDHVKTHGIYVERVKTIKGFYSESLTSALRRQYVDAARKIALVNIDCDLYESAVPVFEFIDPLLQEGAVIYVDDLFAGHKGHPRKGVARAFLEWQKSSRWKVVRHLDVGWWGRSYIVYLDKAGVDGTL